MRTRFLMLPPQIPAARRWAERLAADMPQVEIIVAEDAAAAETAMSSVDAAFGNLTPPLVAKATKLRWLQAPHAAPPTGYYSPELIAHPVVVTNFREIYNDHIAAHVMAYVLAFARGLHRYFPQQLRREWRQAVPRNSGVLHLPETTMLIVGLGGIGAETARLASNFGIRVVATDARRTSAPSDVAELHPAEALDKLLPQADFVVLTVPHTPDTEGFMHRERFARMKRGSYFINIGRGKTTRLNDLVAALEAGDVAGAGLDVFETEPLPADHPLWTMPGVIITPHTAGYGPYLDDRRYEVILGNCRRFIAGEPLKNVVDKSVWF